MKAKDLIIVLLDYLDAEVRVGFEEHGQYSELTSSTEDHIDPVEGVLAWVDIGFFHPNRFEDDQRNCHHQLADASNQVIESGYVCVKCGAVFAAAEPVTA